MSKDRLKQSIKLDGNEHDVAIDTLVRLELVTECERSENHVTYCLTDKGKALMQKVLRYQRD
ncbi:MAG: hypothetical protein AAFX04_03225 [Pseudomonadota bacterium]